MGWFEFKKCLGSTNIVEQFSFFSKLPSILIFEFELILGLFLTFLGPIRLFLGSGFASNTVLSCTHVVKHLLSSKFSSILTLDFGLISVSFFTFWDPNGLFLESK